MKPSQSGAALVISMILLSVLTILAISTMNTAATELMMSGNDQYHARASQAAETGIEQTLATAPFDSIATETVVTATLPDGDAYTARIRPRGPTPAPAGYDNTFTADHFEIESTGTSHREAKVTHVQGLFVVRAGAAAASSASNSSLPPMCLSGVAIRPGLCVEPGAPVRTYWRTGKTK